MRKNNKLRQTSLYLYTCIKSRSAAGHYSHEPRLSYLANRYWPYTVWGVASVRQISTDVIWFT